MTKKNLIIVGTVLTLAAVAGGFGYYHYTYKKYVHYDNINEIQYASPSLEAQKFNIQAHIQQLPEISYPSSYNNNSSLKTYTYHFNNHSLTFSLPSEFQIYEIPLAHKPRIIKSHNLQDSCERVPGSRGMKVCGTDKGFFKIVDVAIRSDKSLCIVNQSTDKSNFKAGQRCLGIFIVPYKSRFQGVSMLDEYVYFGQNKHNYGNKILIDGQYALFSGKAALLLLNNNLELVLGCNSNDLKTTYLNLLHSIKIKSE